MSEPLMQDGTQAANAQSASSDARGPLAHVVYRSRAVAPLGAQELHRLSVDSQARNRREDVTGVMLYDESRFFQWLEGPRDGVDRLMRSIRNDPRHTDLELLKDGTSHARKFDGWDMKLAARGPKSEVWKQDVLEPPREIIDDLRTRPDAAPAVLAKLVPLAQARTAAAVPGADMPLSRKTSAVLTSVMLATVIPTMLAERGLAHHAGRPLHNRAPELAELLIAADQSGALELIAEIHDGETAVQPLYADLLEPAARSLGDLWADDDCSEADVTVGLSRLQTAARMLSTGLPVRAFSTLPQPVVLVVPEPGELHRLGAALDSEVLWSAGWAPHCEYPADEAALQDALSQEWVDVLDLSLSAAFRREHMLPRMARTIADARRASRNPQLMVVVGGRVFVEDTTARAAVGADVASRTSFNVDRLILRSARAAGWSSAAAAG